MKENGGRGVYTPSQPERRRAFVTGWLEPECELGGGGTLLSVH